MISVWTEKLPVGTVGNNLTPSIRRNAHLSAEQTWKLCSPRPRSRGGVFYASGRLTWSILEFSDSRGMAEPATCTSAGVGRAAHVGSKHYGVQDYSVGVDRHHKSIESQWLSCA